jgi:protocatechuate 3,4-dioxygenase beta subunit
MSNAIVDLWHCDAEGVYSHYVAASLGQNNRQTDNSTFLRGIIFHSFLFFTHCTI